MSALSATEEVTRRSFETEQSGLKYPTPVDKCFSEKPSLQYVFLSTKNKQTNDVLSSFAQLLLHTVLWNYHLFIEEKFCSNTMSGPSDQTTVLNVEDAEREALMKNIEDSTNEVRSLAFLSTLTT